MPVQPIQLHTDLETLSRRLTEGFQEELESAIKDQLRQQADVIVAKLAREIAENLSSNISVWRDDDAGRVQVTLVIDGVKEMALKEGR